MRYILKMAPELMRGPRHNRVRAFADIGVRFALGAFVVSTLASMLDPYIAANLSNNVVAMLGGVTLVAIGGCLKSV